MYRRVAIVSLVALLLQAASFRIAPAAGPSQAPGDEFWRDDFGLPAIDGVVKCATIWNGTLIVGGQFYQAGGVAANNVASWDGTEWKPLGNGMDEEVLTLIVYDGALIAGGRFTRAGDVDAPGIARWNGSEWSGVGPGLASFYELPHVAALAIFQGALVATGGFTVSGNNPVARIASWDGIAWRPLGDGLDGTGLTLAVLGDSLFVGGSFHVAGSDIASGVARWSGTEWSPVAGGVTLGIQPGEVTALAIHQGRLYVGGAFDSAGGIPARNVASWGEGAWSALAEGIHARVTCLAAHDGSIVAGVYFGSEGVYQWNGSTWVQTAPMDYGYAMALVSAGSDLIVGGAFRGDVTPGGAIAGFNLARWTGEGWIGYETWNRRMHGLSTMFGGSPHVLTVCAHRGEIVASGTIEFAGDPPNWVPAGMVSRWDGSQWNDILPPSFTGHTHAVESESDTLYADGSFNPGWFPPYDRATVVLRYAGGVWSPMDTIPNTLTCLARFQGSLYMGTARGSSDAPLETGLYRWDGGRWEAIGLSESGNPLYGVRSLVVHDGTLVVGGEFGRIGGIPANNVASWDGTRWEPLGSGLESDWFGVDGLAVWDEKLIAGGSFSALGGNGAAVWNGESWARLGDLNGIASTIRTVRGRLYAGGWFGSVRQHLEGLLQFDGSNWSRVGSGVNGPVHAIAEVGDALVIGGEFTRAGTHSSFGIAVWEGLGQTAIRVPVLTPNWPNPFRGETQFTLRMPRSGSARVSIHDATGRSIVVLAEEIWASGPHVIRWNGRDGSGRTVPTGVYFIRAALADGAVLSRKVVHVK